MCYNYINNANTTIFTQIDLHKKIFFLVNGEMSKC